MQGDLKEEKCEAGRVGQDPQKFPSTSLPPSPAGKLTAPPAEHPALPAGRRGEDARWRAQVGSAPPHALPLPFHAASNRGRSDIYGVKMTISGCPGTPMQSVSNLAGWEFPCSRPPVEALFQISTAGEACDFT